MEPKVQSLIAQVSGGCKVMSLFLRSHGIPYCCSRLIAPYVVCLDSKEQEYVKDTDGNQDLVTSAIQRRIICLVDIGVDDVSKLDHHIVDGSADCSGSDSV